MLSRTIARQGVRFPTSTLVRHTQRRFLSIDELDAQKAGRYSLLHNSCYRSLQTGRERVLILGSGWAGYGVARGLDIKHYQPVVVSPRTYFVFTPLLASTAVGTLEFRTVMESSRRVKGAAVFRGWADDVDFDGKRLQVEAVREDGGADGKVVGDEEKKFWMQYDKLVIAVGCYSQTFNTPGVTENAFFLKDVGDARRIRLRILERFEEASLPTVPLARKRELLHFAVVGGGPTGIEFSAELHDLIVEDLGRLYPTLKELSRITIFDVAPGILGMFDRKLQTYAVERFRRQGIEIQTSHHVARIERDAVVTKEEGRIPVGAVVWSTGLAMNPFITGPLSRSFPHSTGNKLDIVKTPHTGALQVDSHLRVLGKTQGDDQPKPFDGVFALGDCAAIQHQSLPATAQVANQQANWLVKALNKAAAKKPAVYKHVEEPLVDVGGEKEFKFRSLGIMAYLGGWTAITQFHKADVKGRMAWLVWRTAYLTKSVSWRNRVLIPIYWFVNWVLGRDINRF